MLTIMKKVVLPAAFVLIACAIGAMLILNVIYTDAYAVYIDDDFWGYVTDIDSINEQIERVEEEVGEIRNEDYTLDCNIQYEPVFIQAKDVVTLDSVYDYLYNSVDDITGDYILTVDDEVIGRGDYAELNNIIDDVANQYANENTVEVNVLSEVDIEYDIVPTEIENDTNTMENSLNEVSSGSVVYLTQYGDTLEDILEENDLSETEFFALNPDLERITDDNGNDFVVPISYWDEQQQKAAEENGEADSPERGEEAEVKTVIINEDGETEDLPEDLREGETVPEDGGKTEAKETTEEETDDFAEPEETNIDPEEEETFTPMYADIEVMVAPQQAKLVVETKDIEKHDEVIRYVREMKETDELYAGETEIETEGQNGTVEVSETVISQNGTEIDRYESDREVTEEPVNEVILLGTKDMVTVEAYEEPVTVTSGENGVYYASGYMWPLQNYGMSSISSGYGWRYLNGSNEFHSGIDIAAAGGTPILASKDGIVITNTYNSGRGWYIQIDHGDGLITLYQHMNTQSSLTVGSTVHQGQIVGYVGNTGYSFGNHLHFEVWTSDGTVIDPLSVFSGTAQIVTVYTEPDTEETGSENDDVVTVRDTDTNIETEPEVEEIAEEKEVSEETMTTRDSVVAYAESFMDCPYVWGGHGLDMYQTSSLISYANSAYKINIPYSLSTPADVRSYAVRNYGISIPYVFDCSGFTGFVYRHFGYNMPFDVEGQLALGSYVKPDVNSMEPGDLIFFATTGTGKATHVGMYVGNGQYIHASSTYGRVMLDVVRNTDSRPIVGVRRILN